MGLIFENQIIQIYINYIVNSLNKGIVEKFRKIIISI